MDANELMGVILSGKAEGESIKELEGLIERYPYCAIFRMVYLKLLRAAHPMAYMERLKRETVYIPNHRQFYRYLIDDVDFQEKGVVVETTVVEQKEIEKEPVQKIEVVAKPYVLEDKEPLPILDVIQAVRRNKKSNTVPAEEECKDVDNEVCFTESLALSLRPLKSLSLIISLQTAARVTATWHPSRLSPLALSLPLQSRS